MNKHNIQYIYKVNKQIKNKKREDIERELNNISKC